MGLYIFAYADDIAILGQGNKKLDKAWELIWRWSYDNGMEINRKKSGIMMHKGSLKKVEANTHTKSRIPIVQCYKYLGI